VELFNRTLKEISMKSVSMIAAICIGLVAPNVFAKDDNDDKFGARLSGYNEVHFIAGNAAAVPPVAPALRGAVSTKGKGRFKAEIDDAASSISYELSYEDLEGNVTQAHIHFGQHHSVGGIVVWLCQTAGTPAPAAVTAATPICPAAGTVKGTILPSQVLAVTGQGIDAGQFDELVRAIRAGATYANVHSSLFPPGEIRGQLRERGDHKH
jgi:CHRD domain